MEKICKNCNSFSQEQNWVCDMHYCKSYEERKKDHDEKYKGDLTHTHLDAPSMGTRPYWGKGCKSWKVIE